MPFWLSCNHANFNNPDDEATRTIATTREDVALEESVPLRGTPPAPRLGAA